MGMQQKRSGCPIGLVDTAKHVLGMGDWKPRHKVTSDKPLMISTPLGNRALWFSDLRRKENPVRLSEWDEELDYGQIHYAVMDVWANALLLNALKMTPQGLTPSV